MVIQTFLPEHYAIRAALLQDDAAFVEQEMRFRRIFHYPPYTRMVQLLLRDTNRERGLARLTELAGRIARHPRAGELRVTGPATAPLERLRGEWRLQLLVRSAQGAAVRQVVRAGARGETAPRAHRRRRPLPPALTGRGCRAARIDLVPAPLLL